MLEDDAYSQLSAYLNDIKIRLGNDRLAQETINDIEIRVTELLSEKVNTGQAVTLEIVDQIINQIGRPEDITDVSGENFKPKKPKRFYRDPDGSIIAGVCSGLATYFNVDSLVFRIIFLALIFANGLGILLYFILWIALPNAVTPFQKMEMMGEGMSFEEMGEKVKREYEEASERLKKSKTGNFIQKIFSLIGQILLYILKAAFIAVKAISILIGVILIIAMVLLFVAFVGATFFGTYLLNSSMGEIGLSLNQIVTSMLEISSSYWVTIPIFLLFAIPILALIYAGVRIIFRFKAKDALLGIIAAVIWVTSVVTLSLTIFYQARSLAVRENVKTTQTLRVSSKTKLLYLKSFNYPIDSINNRELLNIFDMKLVEINGAKRLVGIPTLSIKKSDDEYPSIEVVRQSRGINHITARYNAKAIDYGITYSDTIITFDPLYIMPQDTKWKNQKLTINLYLPEGYGVSLDSTMLDILGDNQPFSSYWPDEMIGKTWVMTYSGLRVKR